MLKPRQTLRAPEDLAAAGLIGPERIQPLTQVARQYAVAVTPAIARLIDSNDSADPIARQFIPSETELETKDYERADPIGDAHHSPVRGVIHRYRDRVLLALTHVCPVYCRFCFRRETVGPGEDQILDGPALDAALAYIAGHKEIWEVILTGGDPLMLSPRRLAKIVARLDAIAHVKVQRWHTRVPIADPDRASTELVRAVKAGRAATYVVVHVNHPRELSEAARAALARLADAGIPVLSQSVLLKGVNDDVEVLEQLMRALVEAQVKPYYLHHADLAPGTSHFRTSVAEGQALMQALRARVSGLCIPEYVLDIPGGYAKAALMPGDLIPDKGELLLRDAEGNLHRHPEIPDLPRQS